jgi:hypothetical protein
MKLEIPDQALVARCGGDWGNATSTDLGAIVKQYLYSNPPVSTRKMQLGLFLVDVLESHLDRGGD